MSYLQTTIALEKMYFFSYHGCTADERKLGSHYIVDVFFDVNLQMSAIAQDDLSATVDYSEVYLIVAAVMKVPKKLLESVATAIGKKILDDFVHIVKVTVKVTKKNPPLGGLCDQACVTCCMGRDQ